MGISASLIKKTSRKGTKGQKGSDPFAPSVLLWRSYFFNILTRAEKCRPDDSDNAMNVRESRFASMNRGLNRLNRFVAPTRNAIRFPLTNGIGTSFSIPAFVAKNIGNLWPL